MRSRLLDLCFILYCIEAGVFLMLAPWNLAWDRTLFHLPFARLWMVGLSPVVRAAVSGFGLVHLVWGAHELDRLLQTWRPTRRRQPAADS
jgi:hypothetical protein